MAREKSPERLAEIVSKGLQQLEERLDNKETRVEVRFPRGVLRTAESFRRQWNWLNDYTLTTNIAYGFILLDFYSWILKRFALIGTGREMVIKEAMCLVANICESTTKVTMKGRPGGGKGFKERIALMTNQKIIPAALGRSLTKLWEFRKAEHFFLIKDREFGKYTDRHFERAIAVLELLRKKLLLDERKRRSA
jgi:hypothetical protein